MLLGYLLCAALSSAARNRQLLAVLDAIPGRTWEAADSSRVARLSDAAFQAMLLDRRFLPSGPPAPAPPASSDEDVPAEYDYRDKHPQCGGEVFDQGRCGSCWAFAATSTLSDRRCVAGKTEESVPLSQQYQVSCDTRDSGCNGGSVANAWRFFRDVGVPTLDCVGYTREAFEDGIATECPKTCDDGSDISLVRVRTHGQNLRGDVGRIKAAIYREGPVLTSLSIYEDFVLYKSGIYMHLTGEWRGGHAVEVVGYGIENGVAFWRARNSWGGDWGDEGFFRILRGRNECGFEEEVTAGHV